jgi:hypothetical protein
VKLAVQAAWKLWKPVFISGFNFTLLFYFHTWYGEKFHELAPLKKSWQCQVVHPAVFPFIIFPGYYWTL